MRIYIYINFFELFSYVRWRCDIGHRGRDGEGASEERCESCDSSKRFEKSRKGEGKYTTGKPTSCDNNIGDRFELIWLNPQILFSVLIFKVASSYPHVCLSLSLSLLILWLWLGYTHRRVCVVCESVVRGEFCKVYCIRDLCILEIFC